MKFRGLPIEVQAIQWTGDNLSAMKRFAAHDYVHLVEDGILAVLIAKRGTSYAHTGDWIIRGVMGHCYVCEDEAFTLSYAPVKGEPA